MSKDVTNEQLFEFMTKMYGEMQEIKENMATKDNLAKTNQSKDSSVASSFARVPGTFAD